MTSQLKPKKSRRPKGDYWIVSLGKNYTGMSRRRHYFRSRKEAYDFLARAEDARIRLGREAFVLPLNLRAEAFACWQRLKPLNITLTEAVDYFLQKRPLSEPVKPLSDLKDEFLKSRRAMNCRPRTIVQYESYLKVICEEFAGTDSAKIQREDVEDWIEESHWSARTRKNYLVTLTTLLNFAVGKGYRVDNPAATIQRPILDDRPVGILTVEQVKALLRTAQANDRAMTPALAIGLFAGLRRSEFFALDWSEIDLENRTIEVKGIQAKTRQRRLVTISENLLAWLLTKEERKGPVTPEDNIDVFSERLRGLIQNAGITSWPHNAMRHSFGSYFLGQTKDENLTASEMGNSPGVVIRHYRAIVREADVLEYWRIGPTTVA